jgi:hypothetical protein
MNGCRTRALGRVQILACVCFIAVIGTIVSAQPEPRHCAACNAVIDEKLKVVVTDFAASREHLCCSPACAVTLMAEKFPTSRAVMHDPFAGREVRIIRTGVKWIAWPKTAVFLYIEPKPAAPVGGSGNGTTAPGSKPDAEQKTTANGAPPPGPADAAICFAFPRQVEYVQYLATHPDVAAYKPRPLRLTGLLAAVKEQAKAAGKPHAK